MSLTTITLAGSPLEMGRQHGEQLRAQVRSMIQTRLDLAAEAAHKANPRLGLQWCLELAAECVPWLQRYSLPVYQELSGIAEGAGLTLPEMVIGNGWTDFKDLLAVRADKTDDDEVLNECTSLVVGGNLTADGHTYLAQTWDMNVSAGPYMLLVRREPDEGPISLSLTTAGCLSLIGLNETGIAIGNTNLAPRDARTGVFYLALIHRALAQRTLEDAIEAVTSARRMSGHYYYLGGPHGEFMGIETTGAKHDLIVPELGSYVHTNHYLQERLISLGLSTAVGGNSLGRQERMSELAAAIGPGLTAEGLSQALMDHEGGNPICRHSEDPGGAATLGAAIICPQTREMWVTGQNPCENGFQRHQLAS